MGKLPANWHEDPSLMDVATGLVSAMKAAKAAEEIPLEQDDALKVKREAADRLDSAYSVWTANDPDGEMFAAGAREKIIQRVTGLKTLLEEEITRLMAAEIMGDDDDTPDNIGQFGAAAVRILAETEGEGDDDTFFDEALESSISKAMVLAEVDKAMVNVLRLAPVPVKPEDERWARKYLELLASNNSFSGFGSDVFPEVPAILIMAHLTGRRAGDIGNDAPTPEDCLGTLVAVAQQRPDALKAMEGANGLIEFGQVWEALRGAGQDARTSKQAMELLADEMVFRKGGQ